MADDNVEVVRRAIAELNFADAELPTEIFSEDFELDFTNSRGPQSGVYRGLEETREFMRSFIEPWAKVGFDTNEEVTELEDGRVLTVNTLRARGHGSGVEVSATAASIWTVKNGKAAAMKMYQSKEEAIEAAGVSSTS